MNALKLPYAAYVVTGTQKVPVSMSQSIVLNANNSLEVWWQANLYLETVSTTSTPSTNFKLEVYRNGWVTVADDQKSFTVNMYACAIRLTPKAGCVMTLTVEVGAQTLSVDPKEVVLTTIESPVTLQVSTTRSTPVIGWIDGAGWAIVVNAVPFYPIYEMIEEGIINVQEQVLTLEQTNPALPFELNGVYYAYGPVQVLGNVISIASSVQEVYFASPETGVIPVAIGKNYLPVPVNTGYILTKTPASVAVYLPKYRWARTGGLWYNGYIVANDVYKPLVILPQGYTQTNIITFSL